MFLIKLSKILALAFASLNLIGAMLGTAYIFAALLHAVARAPQKESTLFNFAIIGFALVETFMFFLIGIILIIIFF